MSRYYVKVFTDDSNVKEWEDLTPEKIRRIKFKGKLYDEVRHGKWIDLHCSVCGKVGWMDEDNYCPNCGARMNLEGDAE